MHPKSADLDLRQIDVLDITLLPAVNLLSGQRVERCYHCHKCTAGCPTVDRMAYAPDTILRMVALGQREALYKSRDIWLCAGCFTCATRCPNGIDIAAVMDALRQMALARGYRAGERDVYLFHSLFLRLVGYLGRSYEAGLLGMFKLLSRVPIFKDLIAGVKLFLRGKVPLWPRRSGKPEEMRKLFERSKLVEDAP